MVRHDSFSGWSQTDEDAFRERLLGQRERSREVARSGILPGTQMRDAQLGRGRVVRVEVDNDRPILVRYDCGKEESYSTEDAVKLCQICGDHRR